jgi:SRSO17 transposase
MMSKRKGCPTAPGPLERYAQQFDSLFRRLNQREGFRRYLTGLLLPSERNKTLTALANREPIRGAQRPLVQRLQWFLSESRWEADGLNDRRLDLLKSEPRTAPHAGGVLVIDETGDRKAGNQTAHVGRQYLAHWGKVDNGVVSVSALWADEHLYHPLLLEPYTPAHWFARGKQDPAFRTKPQIALELVTAAMNKGIPFRAVVADAFYGENETFISGLQEREVSYVVARKPSHSWWHAEGTVGSVFEVAQTGGWVSTEQPGHWVAIERQFRDGHREVWWALEGRAGPYGPSHSSRLVIATTDPATLPELTTWYLTTNLPHPDAQATQTRTLPAATLTELVSLYGLRIWVEQSYKQIKHSLGWADYQVRSDIAIYRHWQLVYCAFSFCWWAQAQTPDQVSAAHDYPLPQDEHLQPAFSPSDSPVQEHRQRKKRSQPASDRTYSSLLASDPARRTRLARTLGDGATVLEGLVTPPATRWPAGVDRACHSRSSSLSL